MATQDDFAEGLTDCSDPRDVTPKPIAKSASQRLLLTSKPLPPIPNSPPSSEPSLTNNREQAHVENGTGCDDSDGNNKKLTSEEKGYKASLLSLCCGDEDEKLPGMAVIPPIPKSRQLSDGAPGSTAVPLPSSEDLVFQEALEMRPRLSSRSEEKTLKYLDFQTLEPTLPVLQHCGVGGMKSAGHLLERAPPLTDLSLSQDKEIDHLMRPCLPSDDNLKDGNGRIHVTLAKPSQKKIYQKRMRQMELLCRESEKETEKSLQLPTQSVDPESATEESFGPPPVNGTVSISASTSNALRKCADTALKKHINRPSLPSISVISHGGSVPCNPSVTSLPAISLDFLEWTEEQGCGNAQEFRPFLHPQQALLSALTWLSSDDWQQKAKGLFNIRCLAVCHSEVLLCRLNDVSVAVMKEVNNLRSKVSRFAINTLGVLFRTMKKHMDHKVDEVACVLLRKMGDSSEFIQKAASHSLGLMAENVTPARAKTALMASAVRHHNILVRKCAAEHLLTVVEKIGAQKLLSGRRDSTDLLVHTMVKLAQDCHQDTRCYGRKMLNVLMSHHEFDRYLKQSVPSRDLKDVMATIKQKGVEYHKLESPSAKSPRRSRMPKDNLPSDGRLKSGSDVVPLPRQSVCHTSLWTVEDTAQLVEICKLMTAKEFQKRMEGVVLLLDLCKSSPQLISKNIVRIFDIFVLRLQDCNRKVNQQALEVLALMTPVLGSILHPVLVSVVKAVTENLNSKHMGIYAAAVKVLEAFVAHLDNALLLPVFAHRARYLSSQALLDVIEHLSVLVTSVYPRKPQAIKQYALPTLWFFLGNGVTRVRSSNARAALTRLAKSLYQVMGSKLKEYAASQPERVVKNISDILDL